MQEIDPCIDLCRRKEGEEEGRGVEGSRGCLRDQGQTAKDARFPKGDASSAIGLPYCGVKGEELEEFVLALGDRFQVQGLLLLGGKGFAEGCEGPDILGEKNSTGEESLPQAEDAQEEGQNQCAELVLFGDQGFRSGDRSVGKCLGSVELVWIKCLKFHRNPQLFCCSAQDRDLNCFPNPMGAEEAVKISEVFDPLIVDRHQEISQDEVTTFVPMERKESGFLGRSPFAHVKNHDSFETEFFFDVSRGDIDSQGGAADASRLDQFGDDQIHSVYRDREADARISTIRAVEGRVDSNQESSRVQERASRVSGVDGGISLNGPCDLSVCGRLDDPAECADHSCAEGLVKTEGIADGENFLSDLQVLRSSNADRSQAGGRGKDSQDCKILTFGNAHQACRPGTVVGESHRPGGGLFLNDMIVRQNVPLAVPDDAGSLALVESGSPFFVLSFFSLALSGRNKDNRRGGRSK